MNEIEPDKPTEEDKDFVAPETGGETEETSGEWNFLKTEEMRTLTSELVEALKDNSESAKKLAIEWKHRADESASQLSGEQYDHAMIDMIIAQANIWNEAGDMDNYYDDLGQARDYANNMGFNDKVKDIDALMES